jgi:hypothetical protein
MLKRLFVFSAAIASAGAAFGFVKARAQFRTWGIDSEEAAKALPGDEIVADAEAVDTRGIDIAAPPREVWPWLVQMGYGRAGWYSYDELDMDRPSADRIVPELQQLEIGDLLPTHPGGGFVVKVVEPKKALVVYADRALVQFPDEGPVFAPALASRALLFGLFVMVRRQMQGIRDRAEGRPISHSPWRMLKADIRAKAMEAQATAMHGAPTPASA